METVLWILIRQCLNKLELPLNLFSPFWLQRNNTIERGISSMTYANDENFGKIVSWNYKNRTNFFEGHCGDIKGSAGEFYPLNVKRDKLVFYSSELCKYAVLEYEKDVVIKGVRGYKFSAENLFDNGKYSSYTRACRLISEIKRPLARLKIHSLHFILGNGSSTLFFIKKN